VRSRVHRKARRFPVVTGNVAAMGSGGGAASFVGAYDAIPNLAHVYEPARRTLSAYAGNLIRLRRSTDDAEANFSYVTNGDLDTAAISAWLGAGTGFVVTIYDQKGGDNITQATKTAQPTFAASSQNGHAGALFDGLGTFLRGPFTNGGTINQAYSTYALAKADPTMVNDGVNRVVVDGYDSTHRAGIGTLKDPNPDIWVLYAGAVLSCGVNDANWNIFSMLLNGASSQVWINAVSKATGNAGTHTRNGISVGAQMDGSTQFWKGYINSVIVASTTHTDAQRGAMQTALNAYWGVYA
jgi:hypothetical protein